MELLHNTIRPYAWGSRSAIAGIQGRAAPTEGPEAELWLGAHPGNPSWVDRPDGPVGLDTLIAAEPGRLLGDQVVAQFGARLPYLMKILAAAQPLSLQAHPNAEQARLRFAAEREGGGSGPFNYVDANHKPELLVALTPFRALCGFQSPQRSAEILAALRIDDLAPVIACLRSGIDGLREAVRTLLTWPVEGRAGLVKAVVAAAGRPEDAHREPFALATSLAQHYPEDAGVLVALLLNYVRLAPGEAIWMPAGNLHAYLEGTGVEIMAASDNVLRGGLTPKHVDVAELLEVLRFEVLEDPIRRPETVIPGVVTWAVPVPDFALHRVVLQSTADRLELAVGGPRIVLCVRGQIAADDGGGPVIIPSGCSAFAAAEARSLLLWGSGEAYVASVGITDAPA